MKMPIRKIRFQSFEQDDEWSRQKEVISVETEAIYLEELCESFTNFLRANGYHFSGKIELVEEEEEFEQLEMDLELANEGGE